jgi:hypothetical protein
MVTVAGSLLHHLEPPALKKAVLAALVVVAAVHFGVYN